jgi:p-aminobenzoyl-glutamate transporter AbgT
LQNFFSQNHLRNYIFFYVGVVVFVVAFFIVTKSFYEPRSHDVKEFTKDADLNKQVSKDEPSKGGFGSGVKLLDGGYK